MSRQWIDKLEIGQKVDMSVRVVKATVQIAQNRSSYLALTLADRTGEIAAKRWNTGAQEHATLATIKFARIVGNVDEHNGGLQIILIPLPVDIGLPEDLSDFLVCSPLSFEDLRSRLHHHIASVKDDRLNALLRSIFVEDKEKSAAFMEYPAALEMHHTFRHGLLHHTLEVVDMVAAMADQQIRWGGHPVWRDLAVAGALLHDIGKVEEMQEQNFSYEFSEAGSLHGHIIQGAIYVTRRIAKLKNKGPESVFPKELERMLIHLIGSHHGKGEWGSPRPPMTVEALLIHIADKTSADLYYMDEARKQAIGGQAFVKQHKLESGFGGKGRNVFVGDMGMLEPVGNGAIREEEALGFPIPQEFRLPILRLVSTREAEDPAIFSRTLWLEGKIAAGQPLLHSDSPDGRFCVDFSALGNGKGDYYLLRVSGDSMNGDGILDGDFIVAKHQSNANDGDLVVALLDEGATVKRLARKDGKVSLLSSNLAYPPIHVQEGANLEIQGLVIGIARHSA